MNTEDITEKAKIFQNNLQIKRMVEKAWQQHEEFLKLYPYREHPEDIDLLAPDKIYSPGKEDYFFLWIEHKLRRLGAIRIGSANVWENAKNQPDRLKELLKTTVNDSLPLSQKIDAHWEDIKGFGGDKHIAKKIVFVYYPEKVVPVFSTGDLEHFANKLNIDFKKEALERYGKSYDMLSTGQQFELFNDAFLQFKNGLEELKKWDNSFFMRFLYETFPLQRLPTEALPIKPLHSLGILFEPQYEQEVIYLFSVFHRELGFPYIVKIRNEFPDAIVMDENKEMKRIEFEIRASDFLAHGHEKRGCDLIVCWVNDLEEEQIKDLPEIMSIKDSVQEFT